MCSARHLRRQISLKGIQPYCVDFPIIWRTLPIFAFHTGFYSFPTVFLYYYIKNPEKNQVFYGTVVQRITELMASAMEYAQSFSWTSSSEGAASSPWCAGSWVRDSTLSAVGTPTAATGTPTVRQESSRRGAAEPDPGVIPAVESCTVLQRRSGEVQQRESTAMTQAASISRAAARTRDTAVSYTHLTLPTTSRV